MAEEGVLGLRRVTQLEDAHRTHALPWEEEQAGEVLRKVLELDGVHKVGAPVRIAKFGGEFLGKAASNRIGLELLEGQLATALIGRRCVGPNGHSGVATGCAGLAG